MCIKQLIKFYAILFGTCSVTIACRLKHVETISVIIQVSKKKHCAFCWLSVMN
jgi:hypothetical protein